MSRQMRRAGHRGDPGIFGSIAGAFTKVASFIPGPVGTIAGKVNAALSPKPPAPTPGVVMGARAVATPVPSSMPPAQAAQMAAMNASVVGGLVKGGSALVKLGGKALSKLGGGSKVGGAIVAGGAALTLSQLFGGKGGGGHRRMNPLNVKALKRAVRRQDSFVNAARQGLKGTKFQISVRGAGGGKCRPGHKPGCKCVACR